MVLLGSFGDIVYGHYCLFLCWCFLYLGLERLQSWVLIRSFVFFLCGWFVSLFLFPLLFLGELDTCSFFSRAFSLDFESVAMRVLGKMCFSVLTIDTYEWK